MSTHTETQGRRARDLAWQLSRIRLKLAVLKRGWRICPVSDCRRARACMGEQLPCLAMEGDPAVTWTPDEIAAWQTLMREHATCLAALKAVQSRHAGAA